MIDLCLVQLPNPAMAHTMYNSLGILYMAAVVEKAGYAVEIADLRHEPERKLPQARFYGFSCTTPEINYAKDLAKQVDGITIVGGAHPSLLPEDCVGHFDHVVVGEGEEAIVEIMQYPAKSGFWKMPRIKNLDDIPYPARYKVKHPYSTNIFVGERYGEGPPTGTLVISRGCPYNCHFCGNIYRYNTYRSVPNIIGEIKEMMVDGIRHFKFMDDNTVIHPEYKELCRQLGQLDIQYIWHNRSNLLTENNVALMTGCVQHGLGIESADPHVLKLNNKREDVEDHKRAINLLQKAGIDVKVYWMTGLPGETDETIELNKQFMIDTQPTKWTLST